jgi:formyltetrahydrofolate deformylase
MQCVDAPGIVKATASGIADVEGNILENDQFSDPVTGQFCMRTRFESPIDDIEVVRTSVIAQTKGFSPSLGIRHEEVQRRAVIMVSSFDHCLADLLYRRAHGDIPIEICAVISNHEHCRLLCEQYDVPYHYVPVTRENKTVAEEQLLKVVEEFDIDLVILARYMQILSDDVCQQLSGKIINIHHSFLPGFKGARPYHRAYERGVKLIGATAHFVTRDLDEGPIIEQDVVRVSHARQVQDLVAIGRDIERTVLSRAVRLVSEDRVALVGNRTVIFSQ